MCTASVEYLDIRSTVVISAPSRLDERKVDSEPANQNHEAFWEWGTCSTAESSLGLPKSCKLLSHYLMFPPCPARQVSHSFAPTRLSKEGSTFVPDLATNCETILNRLTSGARGNSFEEPAFPARTGSQVQAQSEIFQCHFRRRTR